MRFLLQKRLDTDAETNGNAENRENFAWENEEFPGEGGEGEIAEDVYGGDESFICDGESREYEGYEVGMYEERSVKDEEMEEERSAPSSATITAAEKSEEEVRDVVGPDHVLAEIPVEVRINLSFTVILPVELLCLTTFVIS